MDPFGSPDDHWHRYRPGEVRRQTWRALAIIVAVVVLVLAILTLTSEEAMALVSLT